jgi:hypothetical protein
MANREFRKIPRNIELKKSITQESMSGSIRDKFNPSRHLSNGTRMARKKIIRLVIVFNNLNTPIIMGIDAIHHISITYSSTSESFLFQEDIIAKTNSEKLT